MYRVEELADRKDHSKPGSAAGFQNVIPLPEILSEIAGLPGPYLFWGEGAAVYRDSLEDWSGGEKVIASPALGHPRAAYVGLLALRGGETGPLLPRYLRTPG
jgi:tRNA threonylcarbamoyladenosine biosynthesis protein TsaB